MSIINKWDEELYLGKGAYAEVFKVKIHGVDYALKKFYPFLLTKPDQKQLIEREIKIMSKIDHPKIIKLHRAIIQQEQISLLLEYAAGGSLYDQLKIYKKLPQHQVKRYIKDVVQALEYLHYRPNPILHRDIKPQNLLLDSEGNCKLADFGTANILDGERSSYVGTQQYMAPEMQSCQPHGIQIDIWTLGILIYELLTGETPKNNDLYPAFISRPAEDVIKKLLTKDQNARMTLNQLKEHIWLSDIESIPLSQIKGDCINKLQLLRQKINEKQIIPSLSIKSEESSFSFKKEKSTLQQNQQLNKISTPYIQTLRQRERLKLQILINERKIQKEEKRRNNQRPFLLQQIDRIKLQIKQYQMNISILKVKPLKMEAQCRQLIKMLQKRLEQVGQYVKGLPMRVQSELLQFSDYDPRMEVQPLSEYIFKLKTQMMANRRNALIQLLAAKKTHLDILQMIQIQKDYHRLEQKEEYQPSMSSLTHFSKQKIS